MGKKLVLHTVAFGNVSVKCIEHKSKGRPGDPPVAYEFEFRMRSVIETLGMGPNTNEPFGSCLTFSVEEAVNVLGEFIDDPLDEGEQPYDDAEWMPVGDGT